MIKNSTLLIVFVWSSYKTDFDRKFVSKYFILEINAGSTLNKYGSEARKRGTGNKTCFNEQFPRWAAQGKSHLQPSERLKTPKENT